MWLLPMAGSDFWSAAGEDISSAGRNNAKNFSVIQAYARSGWLLSCRDQVFKRLEQNIRLYRF